eukprot:scaffold720_cov18-Tisochrysis_lutea.AAC.4
MWDLSLCAEQAAQVNDQIQVTFHFLCTNGNWKQPAPSFEIPLPPGTIMKHERAPSGLEEAAHPTL